MDSIREQSYGFLADYCDYVFDDMDFVDSEGEFVVSDEVPLLHVDVIVHLCDDIVVVVQEQHHQSLLFATATDLNVHVHVSLVTPLLVSVSHRVDLQGVVLDENGERFVEVGELGGLVVVDFDEWAVQGLQVEHLGGCLELHV